LYKSLFLLSVCVSIIFACQSVEYADLNDDLSSYYARTSHILILKPQAEKCESKSEAGGVYADNLILWTDYKEYLEVISQIEKLTREQNAGSWIVKQELAYDRGVCLISLYQTMAYDTKVSNWDCRKSSISDIKYYPDSDNIFSKLSSKSAFECHTNFDYQHGMISLIGEVDGQQVSSHKIRK